MEWNKTNILKRWATNFALNYTEFRKESKNYRCKIIDVNIDKKTKEVTLQVMINGIKKQIIPFLPKELVVNDAMLDEFSSFDVRAITFYAMESVNQQKEKSSKYCINGQEFFHGKTVFIIKKTQDDGVEVEEERRPAHELYCDSALLTEFSHDDLKNIISTAIQEQAIEDFKDDKE